LRDQKNIIFDAGRGSGGDTESRKKDPIKVTNNDLRESRSSLKKKSKKKKLRSFVWNKTILVTGLQHVGRLLQHQGLPQVRCRLD
jgi:hypothetical protein